VTGASRPSVGRATALVAFAACCFGSIGVLTVVATREGTSLDVLLGGRYLLAALVLLLVAGGPRRVALAPSHAMRTLLLGGGGQAAVAGLSLTSLRYIPAATLAFLFYTYPAWVALLAVARGSEKVDARRVVALALSLAGIVVMVGSPWSAPMPLPGVLLALASAVIYALYIPLLGRLQEGTTGTVVSTYISLGAGVLFAARAAWLGDLTLRLPVVSWIVMAALAVLCTAVAFIAFLRGLGVLGPVRSAIVSTVEPFWTAVLAAIILSQPLTTVTIIGGALIAAAVVLLQLKQTSGSGP
jgi:drug/metabolite transporter (DMT)-like permease